MAVKLFDADGSLEAAGGAAFADGSVEGIARALRRRRRGTSTFAPSPPRSGSSCCDRLPRGSACRADGAGAFDLAGLSARPVVERVGAALPAGRRRGSRACAGGSRPVSGRRHRTACRHVPPSSMTRPGAVCWRATKWGPSDEPATCPRLPDALPRDRSRHGLAARGHVHTLAARARLVGDLPGDRGATASRGTRIACSSSGSRPTSAATRRRRSSPPAKFDLALLAFWEPASRLLPILRAVSPDTRVVVDSIDVHFLRDGPARPRGRGAARRAIRCRRRRRAQRLPAGRRGAHRFVERGQAPGRLPRARADPRDTAGPYRGGGRRSRSRSGTGSCSSATSATRRTARRSSTCAATSCRGSLRTSSPSIPCTWSAAASTRASPRTARGLPNVKMVGWVPSVEPYLERARVCVVPLLHGAGVKGKVVESLMAGTPVVTTTIGAEGIDLRHGEHVLIADTPQELADGLAHLLTDRARWERLADAGYEHAPRPRMPRNASPSGSTRSSKSVLAAPPRVAHGGRRPATGRPGARPPTAR